MDVSTAHRPAEIGGYRLLLPVGTGGMGTVYLAEREVVPGVVRPFAVKLLHGPMFVEAGAATQLLQEARLAAQIDHPNVVRVFEADERPEGVFMVMEYIEGTTLSTLIRETMRAGLPTPIREIGRILTDALLGLHAAHESRDRDGRRLGLIHRDFSPQNILVGLDGKASLTDFGIAKVVGESHHTTTGLVKGKIGYMAPEQALGQALDRRCDVWAAGVVLWEAIAGRRLFQATNDAAALLRIVSGAPPPRLSEVRDDIGPGLDAICRAALARDPADRIRDANELRTRLETAWEALGGLAERAEVAEWVERAAGATSSAIRAKVQSVRAARESVGLGAPATVETATIREEQAPRTDAVSVSGIIAGGRGKGTRKLAMWLAAGGALAALVWVVARGSSATTDGSATTPETASGAPLALASAPPPPLSEAAPGPSASASPAADPDRLVIVADAPIAQIKLGARSIALAEPSDRVEIVLRPEEHATLPLVALSADRRRVAIEVDTRTGEARVEFATKGGAPSPPPKWSKPTGVGGKKPGPGEPGIVSDPYGPK